MCGAGRGGGVISYICHSTDLRAEWPFFQRCQLYGWPLFFFNKKYMHDPIFQDSYVKGPIFLTSWYIHIFSPRETRYRDIGGCEISEVNK